MVDVTGSARRLYRRILGVQPPAEGQHPGVESATDGATAVAVTEICAGEAAGLGASFPGAVSAGRYRDDARRQETDLLGRPLTITEAGSARGSLAAATGQALAGLRATAFLSGPDLAASLGLLTRAAGRRVPMVVHLAGRANPGAGDTPGSGHEAYHAAAETGALLLFAANVQEAVDFSLIARRAAEDALAPAVVAMDGAETAFAVQDACLPSRGLVETYLDRPDRAVHPTSPAQEMLFGRLRRRVPRWHDVERPLLTGARQRPGDFARAVAGRRAYFDAHLAEALERALAEYAAATGRRHETVSAHRTEDAELVLVAQGAAVETAQAVADHLRGARKLKVGVIGIRSLRPFPAARLVELLKGRKTALVLERAETPLGGDPPLLREVRAALDRGLDNGRHGGNTHPGIAALSERDQPRLGTAFYGLGGQPLRASDLAALVAELAKGWRSPVFLGIDLSPADSTYPKREVLLDALRRHYPVAARMGLRTTEAAPPLLPADAITVAVHRVAGRGGERLAGDAAALLHRLLGGHVRTRTSLVWESWDAREMDLLNHAPAPFADPGDDAPAEIAVWASGELPPDPSVVAGLRDGGALVFEHGAGASSVWNMLPARVRREVKERGLKLYMTKRMETDDPALRAERLLGALAAALIAEARIDTNSRKLLAARRDLLTDLGPERADRLTAVFQAGADTILKVETGGLAAPDPAEEVRAETPAPASVRALGRTDEQVDSLPRFWDQVGVLYERDETDVLGPDPYLATATLPPLTASFRDLSASRDTLPVFDPAACTGCGACWSICPDSAIRPVAIGAQKLVEQGMALVKNTGASAEPLRMAVSKLAARVNEVMSASSEGGGPAGPVLDAAFEKLMAKMPLAEDRKQSVTEAFGLVRDAVAALPVARTVPFFDDAESDRKGSGELFTLAINPEACKACRLCISECEPAALSAEVQDAALLAGARRIWRLVAELPEPPAGTIAAARDHAEAGALAGALLSRSAQLTMVGGDGAEPGSGEKIAVRQALAIAQHHLDPQLAALRETVGELRESLGTTIREHMADALPTGDLDALADGLDTFDRPDVDLAGLTGRVEAAFDTGRVDVPRLRRLVETARGLAELEQRIGEGGAGGGRARFGLVFAPGSAASWAGAFPTNPFAAPVTLDAGPETLDLARGLIAGQIQEALEGIRLLRRARLEMEKPAEAARAGEQLDALAWDDLTEEERRLCPPLFLGASESALAEGALGSLANLLADRVPLKVIALCDLDLGLSATTGPELPGRTWSWNRADLAATALAHPAAFVAQTSLGHPEHLALGLAEALDFDGPAVIRVHAPSPSRHGFGTDGTLRRAREAVDSRAYPLFRSNPLDRRESPLAVDLDGNPEPAADWMTLEDRGPLTPAHWALNERRFEPWFGPVPKGAETVPLVEYLALPVEEREGKTVVIERAGDDEPLAVHDELVRACEERLAVWRALGERARGRAAPPAEAEPAAADRQRAEMDAAAEALRQQHAQEMAALQQSYEARLAALRAETQVEMARRVKGRLLSLVARRAGNGGGEKEPDA